MVARSVFERLEASGFRELTGHLTEEARVHAFAAAVPAQFTASVGYGRRLEWIGGQTFQLTYAISTTSPAAGAIG
jgi:hypothetical protein